MGDLDIKQNKKSDLFLRTASFFDVVPLFALIVPLLGWYYLGLRVCNSFERLTNQSYSLFSCDGFEYSEEDLEFNGPYMNSSSI